MDNQNNSGAVANIAPQDDKDFMGLSPQDKHAYLMDTDPDYHSLTPADQTAYMMHVVAEGAKKNIAQYPPQDLGQLTPEQYMQVPEDQRKAYEARPRNLSQEVGEAAPQPTSTMGRGMASFDENVNQPMNKMGEWGTKKGGKVGGFITAGPEVTPEERAAHPTLSKINDYARATGRAAGSVVGGQLTDPRQLALLVGSMGSSQALPILSRIASAGFSGQMAAGVNEGAKQLGADWDNLTGVQRYERLLKLGIDTVFAGLAGGHALNEPVTAAAKPAVRAAGRTIEGASTPAAIGGGVGIAADYVGHKLGIPMHGAAEYVGVKGAEAIARGMGKNPYEPMVRVPKMTNFGLPKEPTAPPFAEVGDTSKDVFNPEKTEAPEDPRHTALKAAFDKANSDFQKAHEAREAYAESIAQGFDPPSHIQKAYDKAEAALDEARFHLQTYEERGQARPQAEQPKPTDEFKPEPVPQVRGGQHELPGGGVMGKPLQLPGEVPEPESPVGQASTEQPESPTSSPLGKVKVSQQVDKAGDLIQEGLGGKPLEPKVPLREQVPNAPKRVVEEPAQSKPATEQAEVQHLRNLVHANGEALSNAIPKTPEGVELLQKLHDLSNPELRQLAINLGEDMGQMTVGRKKQMGSGQITRPELFERLLKNYSAEDLGRAVDDGKHLPPVGGGSQGADRQHNESGNSPPKEQELRRLVAGELRKLRAQEPNVNEEAERFVQQQFPDEKDDVLPDRPALVPSSPELHALASRFNKSLLGKVPLTKEESDLEALAAARETLGIPHTQSALSPEAKLTLGRVDPKALNALKERTVNSQYDYGMNTGTTLNTSFVRVRDNNGNALGGVTAREDLVHAPGTFTVHQSGVSKSGFNIGREAYRKLFSGLLRESAKRGEPIRVQGDSVQSPEAKATWNALLKEYGGGHDESGRPYIVLQGKSTARPNLESEPPASTVNFPTGNVTFMQRANDAVEKGLQKHGEDPWERDLLIEAPKKKPTSVLGRVNLNRVG
jgi:hypothetical protein